MTHKFFFGEEIDLTKVASISEPKLLDSNTIFKNNPYSGQYIINIVLDNGTKLTYKVYGSAGENNIKELLEKDKQAWRRYVRNRC